MIITMMNSLFGNRNRIDGDGLADISSAIYSPSSTLRHEWKPQPPTMCHFCHLSLKYNWTTEEEFNIEFSYTVMSFFL